MARGQRPVRKRPSKAPQPKPATSKPATSQPKLVPAPRLGAGGGGGKLGSSRHQYRQGDIWQGGKSVMDTNPAFKVPTQSGGTSWKDVGGGFLKALSLIDKPRAAITSHVKESVDFLQGEGYNPRELWSQFNRNIGFGEVVEDIGVLEDNIWAKRVAGFAGEVALDPLTYLTGGISAGVKGGATATKAASLASKIDNPVLKQSLTKIAAKTAQKGPASLTASEVATFQAAELASRATAGAVVKGAKASDDFADLAVRAAKGQLDDASRRRVEKLAPTQYQGGARLTVPFTGRMTRGLVRKTTGKEVAEKTVKILPQGAVKYTPRGLFQAARAGAKGVQPSSTMRRLFGGDYTVLKEAIATGDPQKVADSLLMRKRIVASSGAAAGWAGKTEASAMNLLRKIGADRQEHIMPAMTGDRRAIAMFSQDELGEIVRWREEWLDSANEVAGVELMKKSDVWAPNEWSKEMREFVDSDRPDLEDFIKQIRGEVAEANIKPGRKFVGEEIFRQSDLENNPMGLNIRQQADRIMAARVAELGGTPFEHIFDTDFMTSVRASAAYHGDMIRREQLARGLAEDGIAVSLHDNLAEIRAKGAAGAADSRAQVRYMKDRVARARRRQKISREAVRMGKAEAKAKQDLVETLSKSGRVKTTGAWRNYHEGRVVAIKATIDDQVDGVKALREIADKELADVTEAEVKKLDDLLARLRHNQDAVHAQIEKNAFRHDRAVRAAESEWRTLARSNDKIDEFGAKLSKAEREIEKASQDIENWKDALEGARAVDVEEVAQTVAEVPEIVKKLNAQVKFLEDRLGEYARAVNVNAKSSKGLSLDEALKNPTVRDGRTQKGIWSETDDKILRGLRDQREVNAGANRARRATARLKEDTEHALGMSIDDALKQVDLLKRQRSQVLQIESGATRMLDSLGLPDEVPAAQATEWMRSQVRNAQGRARRAAQRKDALLHELADEREEIQLIVAAENIPKTSDNGRLTHATGDLWDYGGEAGTGYTKGEEFFGPVMRATDESAGNAYPVLGDNPMTYTEGVEGVWYDALQEAFADGLKPKPNWGKGWNQVAERVNQDGFPLRDAIEDVFGYEGDVLDTVKDLVESGRMFPQDMQTIAKSGRQLAIQSGHDTISYLGDDGVWYAIPLDRQAVEGLSDAMPEDVLSHVVDIRMDMQSSLYEGARLKQAIADDLGTELDVLQRGVQTPKQMRDTTIRIKRRQMELREALAKAHNRPTEAVNISAELQELNRAQKMLKIAQDLEQVEIEKLPQAEAALLVAKKEITGLEAAAANAAADLKRTRKDTLQTFGDVRKHIKAMDKMSQTEYEDLISAGMKQIGAADGGAYMIPEWTAEGLENMSKLRNKEGLVRYLDSFTHWWKAQATFSPGFHARNFFGGAINNYSAGVEVGRYAQFNKLHREFKKAARATSYEQARLAIAESGLPLADEYLQLQRSNIFEMGQFATELDFIMGDTSRNPLNTQFVGYKKSQEIGTRVEETLRGALALDTMAKGGTLDDAIAQVHTFHFDYDDLSDFERNVVRRAIPFYTWSRKNLPLQLQLLVDNPRAFQRYNSVKRNLEIGTEEEEIFPNYLRRLNAIRAPWALGADRIYLSPQTPFSDMTGMMDWRTLAASANPAFRVPAELATGQAFFTGAPFGERHDPAPTSWGPLGISPALEALGMATRDDRGTLQVPTKTLNVINSFMPVAGALYRIDPAAGIDPENAQTPRTIERRAVSMVSWLFGLGGRVNTPLDMSNELYRQAGDFDSQIKKARELGQDPEELINQQQELRRAAKDLRESR